MAGHWATVIGYVALFAVLLVAMVVSRLPPLKRLRSAARLRHSAIKRGTLVFAAEGVPIFVLLAVVGPYTSMRELLHWPFLVALMVIAFGAYVQQEHKRGGPSGPKACGRCKYPRPEERAPHSEVCSECGNRWWEGPWHDGLRFWAYKDRWGTRTLRSAERKRDRHPMVWVCTGLFVVIVLGEFALRMPAVQAHLPTPVLVALAHHPDDHAKGSAVEGLLKGKRLSQEQRDALLERLIEERTRPSDAITSVGGGLSDAIARGEFGAPLVERFFSESIEYTLEAEVSSDWRTVTPRIDMRAWARTIELQPRVASAGLRVNNGAWEQPVPLPATVEDIADTYVDYWMVQRNGEPFATSANRAPAGVWTPRFSPVSIEDLPPGEHTLTVRVHLTAVPGVGGSHTYIGLEGAITPHPSAIWHETRDLTATFTVPESAR